MAEGLRPWVSTLTLKDQCVLFSAMRGPDCGRTRALKQVVRWLRGLVVYSLERGHYTRLDGPLPAPRLVVREAEWLTVHYLVHLCEGLAVVASEYPDGLQPGVRARAGEYLEALAFDVRVAVERAALPV